eukprot:tig00001215_g7582.t1
MPSDAGSDARMILEDAVAGPQGEHRKDGVSRDTKGILPCESERERSPHEPSPEEATGSREGRKRTTKEFEDGEEGGSTGSSRSGGSSPRASMGSSHVSPASHGSAPSEDAPEARSAPSPPWQDGPSLPPINPIAFSAWAQQLMAHAVKMGTDPTVLAEVLAPRQRSPEEGAPLLAWLFHLSDSMARAPSLPPLHIPGPGPSPGPAAAPASASPEKDAAQALVRLADGGGGGPARPPDVLEPDAFAAARPAPPRRLPPTSPSPSVPAPRPPSPRGRPSPRPSRRPDRAAAGGPRPATLAPPPAFVPPAPLAPPPPPSVAPAALASGIPLPAPLRGGRGGAAAAGREGDLSLYRSLLVNKLLERRRSQSGWSSASSAASTASSSSASSASSASSRRSTPRIHEGREEAWEAPPVFPLPACLAAPEPPAKRARLLPEAVPRVVVQAPSPTAVPRGRPPAPYEPPPDTLA